MPYWAICTVKVQYTVYMETGMLYSRATESWWNHGNLIFYFCNFHGTSRDVYIVYIHHGKTNDYETQTPPNETKQQLVVFF